MVPGNCTVVRGVWLDTDLRAPSSLVIEHIVAPGLNQKFNQLG